MTTHLVASGAARLLGFGVVPPAVEISVPLEVDEVHQQLLAHAAHEAAGMPAQLGAQPLGKDHDVTARQGLLALENENEGKMCGVSKASRINKANMLEFFER